MTTPFEHSHSQLPRGESAKDISVPWGELNDRDYIGRLEATIAHKRATIYMLEQKEASGQLHGRERDTLKCLRNEVRHHVQELALLKKERDPNTSIH